MRRPLRKIAAGDAKNLFKRGDAAQHFAEARLSQADHPLLQGIGPNFPGAGPFVTQVPDFLVVDKEFMNSRSPGISGVAAVATAPRHVQDIVSQFREISGEIVPMVFVRATTSGAQLSEESLGKNSFHSTGDQIRFDSHIHQSGE